MRRVQNSLIAVLIVTIFLAAALGATLALGGFLTFAYRTAPGFSLARTLTQIAIGITGLGLLGTLGVGAVAAALQPADWKLKLLYTFPLYALGLVLVGGLLLVLGIGTTGPFAVGWLAISGILTLISSLLVIFRIILPATAIKFSLGALAISGIGATVASLGLIATVVIISTTTPNFTRAPGGPGGPGFEARGTPNAAVTPRAPNGTPRAQGTPAARPPNAEGGERVPPAGGFGGNTTLPFIGASVVAVLLTAGQIFLLIRARGTWQTARAEMATITTVAAARPSAEFSKAGVSLAILLMGSLLLIQLIPVTRTNPPVTFNVTWDSPQTQQLVERACLDCHSNQTSWPWYAYAAPGSWLLASHVSEARSRYNFSELDKLNPNQLARTVNDMAENIQNGTMPPSDYVLMHPAAKLTEAERTQLIQGLRSSLLK